MATSTTLKNEGQEKDTTLRGTVSEIVKAGDVNQAIDKAKDASSDLINRGQEYLDKGKELAGQYSDDAVAYVRRYPMQSVLVGFGVGLLVGAILTPKRFV